MPNVIHKIRRIHDEDEIERCAQLMSESDPWKRLYFSYEQCLDSLSRPDIEVYGAWAGPAFRGFLASLAVGISSEPLLEYLCIDAEYRGQGVGSELISYFEDVLFPEADNLYLFVSDINPEAIRLYVRLGYLCVGALPNYNITSQTEFLHRKSRRPKQARHQAPTA